MFTATNEQQSAIDNIVDGNNVIINSTAGSGKTALANYVADLLLQDNKDVLFTSFSNAGVIKHSNAFSLTTTKLGGSILSAFYWSHHNHSRRKYYPFNKKFNKYNYLTRFVLKNNNYDPDDIYIMMDSGLRQMVDLVRQYNASPDQYEYVWNTLHYSAYNQEFTYLIKEILDEGINRFLWNSTSDEIDCTWIPNQINMEFAFDGFRYYTGNGKEYIEFPVDNLVIIADEAQDLSISDVDLLLQFNEYFDTQLVFVGDSRNQAIYAWRGAAGQAFDYIESKLEGDINKCYINTSWRCPQSHTEYIRNLPIEFENIPRRLLEENIFSHPDNDYGVLEVVPSVYDVLDNIVPGKTLFTGRNIKGNKGTIIPALRTIIENTDYTVRLEGFNVAYLTNRLLNKMQDEQLSIDEVNVAKNLILIEEQEKINKDKNYYVNLNDLIEELDFATTLVNLCSNCNTVSDIRAFIKTYMDSDNPDCVFSTYFRIKGATYPVVVVLEDKPGFDIRNSRQINEQEINGYFVMLTRSNKEMYIVKS